MQIVFRLILILAILTIAMWLFVFYSTDFAVFKSFLIVFGTGIVVYFIYAKLQKQWPYRNETDALLEKAERTGNS